MGGAAAGHPTWEELAAFDSGRLATSDWPRVERHVAACHAIAVRFTMLASRNGTGANFELPKNSASGVLKRRMVEAVWCNFGGHVNASAAQPLRLGPALGICQIL